MTKSPIERLYGPNRCLTVEEDVGDANPGDLYIAEGRVTSSRFTDYHVIIYIDSWRYPIVCERSAQVKIGDTVKVFGCMRKHVIEDSKANESFSISLQVVKLRVLLSVNGQNKGS